MNYAALTKPASALQIVKGIAREYAQGRHQRNPQELPFEVQFRVGCTWGRALSYANDIRTGRIQAA